MNSTRRLLQISRIAWASPCSAVGLLFTVVALLLGGSASLQRGVLEVAFPRWAQNVGGRFGAITFGHVVLGRSDVVLAQLRAHELEHVRQYERWGPIFFIAYPLSSLMQLLRGRNPYWFNYF